MLAANDNLHHNGVGGHVAPLDIEPQPRKRLQQPGVERSHLAVSYVMRIERLIVKTRRLTKGAHDACEVVFIFPSDVLVDDLKTGRHLIFRIHGNRSQKARLAASRDEGVDPVRVGEHGCTPSGEETP